MCESEKGDVTSARGIIVHGCNNRGVMGSGVALAIKSKFPAAYRDYKAYEAKYGLRLGDIIVSHQPCGTIIINAITQDGYGRDSRKYVSYDAVQECFRRVAQYVKALAHPEGVVVNYPLIGAGLGGGRWEVISQIINIELDGIEHKLWTR